MVPFSFALPLLLVLSQQLCSIIHDWHKNIKDDHLETSWAMVKENGVTGSLKA